MIKLELVTLNGSKLQDEVYEVVLPTADGSIAVYKQHMPLVSVVVPGVIAVRRRKSDSDDQINIFATNGGVVEVGNDTVRLLVDEADEAEAIVEQEAAEALAAARKLKDEAKDQIELDHAQALIDRESTRLKVAELRRHRRVRSHQK